MPPLIDRLPKAVMAGAIEAAENRRVPDALLRWGIRRLCAQRATREAEIGRTSAEFADQMLSSEVAIHTSLANRQHYEVPTALFHEVLGPYMKYSACVFESEQTTLAEAERQTLEMSCERAGLEDGMQVLDLGCGWGSLSTYIAETFPNCRVTAVSNSSTQREWIEARCLERGWSNLDVRTADAAEFDMGESRFDRVFSIEMFEHMRNWPVLFDRIAQSLRPDGCFFMHVFCHRSRPYWFENEGEPDWMARNFFSGGIMPSFDLPRHVKSSLEVEREWAIDGRHYARTLRAWLDRLDARNAAAEAIFAQHLEAKEIRRAIQRWRMFFMACEELFAFDGGREWFVGHYRMKPHRGTGASLA